MNKVLLIFVIISSFASCNNESTISTDNIEIEAIEEFAKIDGFLNSISDAPQQFTASSKEPSTITGNKGTIIHVNPSNLETIDGTELGSVIEIELIELHDNSSLILNNTPTLSNGELLVTGGAYYINMKSDGKQLKLNQESGLNVEFPKITEEEMTLFFGERDSLGQMNWIPTNNKFAPKSLSLPDEPKKKIKYIKKTSNEIDAIFGYIDGEDSKVETKEEEEVSKEEYEQYLKQKEEIETQNKTYETVQLLNFGWINCDRFLNDPGEKKSIELIVKSPEIKSARLYVVFTDINSIMQENYYEAQKESVQFTNIPLNKEVTIFAISALGSTPMIYKKKITAGSINKLEIAFEETPLNELKSALHELN